MARHVGGFRTPEAANRFYEKYDDMVTRRWPVPAKELQVATRHGTTHVRRSGPESGVPIVMIHPTAGSSAGWHPTLIAALCQSHPVVTPDTIGTPGRSIQREPIRSSDDLTQWLDDVLDALALDKVHLCGYSEGGWIAGTHAAGTRNPRRLATLTLIEPGGAIDRVPRRVIATMILKGAATLKARDKRQAIQDFNRWMNGDIELTDDELDLVELVFGSFRQKLPTPGRLSDDQLRAVATPTLLLLAENTILYDPEQVAERARRLLPHVSIDITPEAGHGVAYQYPERMASLILSHVEAAHHGSAPPA